MSSLQLIWCFHILPFLKMFYCEKYCPSFCPCKRRKQRKKIIFDEVPYHKNEHLK